MKTVSIYDNINHKFEDGLKDMMQNDGVKRVDFCVGYFNLRGWDRIIDYVDKLPGDYVDEGEDGEERVFRVCRLLIGMNRPITELVRDAYGQGYGRIDNEKVVKYKRIIAEEFRRQLLIGHQSKRNELTLRRLSQQMKDGKVCVKLYLRGNLHAKLYIAYRPNDKFVPQNAIMGSSNLTFPGLNEQGELNAPFNDGTNTEILVNWFDDRWNEKFCVDITKDLIDAIDNSWASTKVIPPYYIYLKTAYWLSQDARAGISTYQLDPIFKKVLFPFQENAVKIAAKHLMNENHKGAMIGDVVGLGKTITACAIAKIFEDNFSGSTLIICPANLQDMWQKYIDRYDLKATVMSNAKHIDVDNMRYYRLVIIDESHNLRNSEGTRYKNIKEFIHSQDNSVLLLTATPYNKDFSDLSTQLKLFLSEDQDLGIRPEAYIKSLGGDNAFKRKHSDVFIRSIRAFEKSDKVEDWNELMKLFLVRRTRTFIKENYAKEDPENGRKFLEFSNGHRSYFPDRIPKAVKFKTQEGDQYSRLYSQDMLDLMDQLVLPRYGLDNYVSDKKREEAKGNDKKLLDNLSRAGKRMMGFCRSTFFKRIDSSGFSFLLTLYRHILRNCIFIYAIKNKLPLPIADENQLPDEFQDDDDVNSFFGINDADPANVGDKLTIPTDLNFYMKKAEEYYNLISSKGNVSWLEPSYFKRTLKEKLNSDCNVLIKMIQLCGPWEPAHDEKMNELEHKLKEEHKNDKVLVFTQYSDTALYIYRELKRRGMSQIDVCTGNSKNPTTIVNKFSPKSNDINDLPESDQTRVLIATDVLSEGQNLQDAHIIMNFDLPWAIIRLIQRAGRVDRIGQTADQILCYSFFPAEGIEKIIDLRQRLQNRLKEANLTLGGDEVFFEGDEVNLTNLYNEKANLEDEDDADVDLSSQAYEIWNQAIKANPKLKDIIPHLADMIYSTKPTTQPVEEGVVTYVRTPSGFDMLSWYDKNGDLVSQSQKRILKAMECSIDTPAVESLENHLDLVTKASENIQVNNTNYSGMLGNRFSTRYKIIDLLEKFYEFKQKEIQSSKMNNLFYSEQSLDDIKNATNEIYNYPLLDTVKTTLGRMLHNKKLSPEDIVDSIVELYKGNQLVHKPKEEEEVKENKVICSMGFRYQPDK
jgi:superfamily II DNA or RNA helicase